MGPKPRLLTPAGLGCILAAVVLQCAPATDAFFLRVTPEFQAIYLDTIRLPPGMLLFINDGAPTPLLRQQFNTGLLKFDERYTYVEMEWVRQPDEFVNYTMTATSGDTTIMATPNITGAPLFGEVPPVLTKFNTSLVCLREGETVLEVIMNYTYYKLAAVNDTANDTGSGDTTNTTGSTDPMIISAQNFTATLRVRKDCEDPPQPIVPSSNELSSGAIAGIVIGVVVLAAVAIILALVSIRHRALHRKTRALSKDLVKMNEIVDSDMRLRTTTGYSGYNGSTAGLPPMSEEDLATVMTRLREEHNDLDDYLVAEEDVVLGEEIGRGAFGRVHEGKVTVEQTTTDGEPKERSTLRVAIKTIKSAVREQDIEEFLAEASLMKGFHHPNVVALVGICMEGNVPPKVCLEFMGMGDLRGYLRKSRGISETGEVIENEENVFSVETPQLLIFCLHIAQGMAYLERKKFVHRDLATRNCMLNDQLIVKIGDFGLARDIHEDNYYRMGTARRLPVKWMSLESLQDQIYTTMSDVWSFGIVMWEVFNLGQSPYPGLANDELPPFLLSGKRLGRPTLCPEDLYAMMATCWSKEPSERPSFQELTRLLVDYKDSFYANVPLKQGGFVPQDYQNINPKTENAGAGANMERTMSMSAYSHAGSMATTVTYVQDSEGRLYVYSQNNAPQYSTQSGHQYSTESQYTGGSADFVNPGYHLVNTNVIPPGYVCLPPTVNQQMVLMNQTGAVHELDPYRDVPVAITAVSGHQQAGRNAQSQMVIMNPGASAAASNYHQQQQQGLPPPTSPTVSMATSIPPPPPDLHMDEELQADL